MHHFFLPEKAIISFKILWKLLPSYKEKHCMMIREEIASPILSNFTTIFSQLDRAI
jgi:hypothetical protein